MRSLYKKFRTKVTCGPAGIKCRCCRGYIKSLKSARTMNARILRRTNRLAALED
jgi:hypothetical protein